MVVPGPKTFVRTTPAGANAINCRLPPVTETTTLVAHTATLDGFVDATTSADGICVRDLEPLTTLVVRTCNSRYRIIVSCASTILVQGGRFFPEVTDARLEGSSAGGSFLKVAWIGVGLRMEISAGGQRIVTSPVRAITTERLPSARTTH